MRGSHFYSELEFEQFASAIYKKTGIDLLQYKNQQLVRRIISIIESAGYNNLRDFSDYVFCSDDRLKEFINDITINISEFFRDKKTFTKLQTDIIPMLYQKQSETSSARFKVWSAGCSNGAELYSVAIILDELNFLGKSFLVGTDISSSILEKAKEGAFAKEELKNVSMKRQLKYFIKNNNQYQINELFRKHLIFKYHDLLQDDTNKQCDFYNLILCRNVIIYFTEEIKKKIYKRFYESLKKGGILFIGGTERIINPDEFGFNVISPFFYEKV